MPYHDCLTRQLQGIGATVVTVSALRRQLAWGPTRPHGRRLNHCRAGSSLTALRLHQLQAPVHMTNSIRRIRYAMGGVGPGALVGYVLRYPALRPRWSSHRSAACIAAHPCGLCTCRFTVSAICPCNLMRHAGYLPPGQCLTTQQAATAKPVGSGRLRASGTSALAVWLRKRGPSIHGVTRPSRALNRCVCCQKATLHPGASHNTGS